MKNIIILILMALPVTGFAQANGEDWAGFGRYAEANANVQQRPKAVLLGDSITDGWASQDPAFFKDNNLIGRGISGQTTSQILVRMHPDVVELKPEYVIILCGINDIAHNPGYAASVENAVGSIKSMCEIAKANKIKPIICTLLPSYRLSWRPAMENVYGQVLEFNRLLKEYAKENRIKVADYFTLLAGEDGKISGTDAKDSVHPTLDGYRKMEAYILEFIK